MYRALSPAVSGVVIPSPTSRSLSPSSPSRIRWRQSCKDRAMPVLGLTSQYADDSKLTSTSGDEGVSATRLDEFSDVSQSVHVPESTFRLLERVRDLQVC